MIKLIAMIGAILESIIDEIGLGNIIACIVFMGLLAAILIPVAIKVAQ
jgi:hypothetical protein